VHYLALSSITLHYLALSCIILHILHYLALSCTILHYLALPCTILHYLALSCITLHYLALPCIILHYLALSCAPLPTPLLLTKHQRPLRNIPAKRRLKFWNTTPLSSVRPFHTPTPEAAGSPKPATCHVTHLRKHHHRENFQFNNMEYHIGSNAFSDQTLLASNREGIFRFKVRHYKTGVCLQPHYDQILGISLKPILILSSYNVEDLLG
jgi:hypothetical protein